MAQDFVHLHVHTDYSLLDGATRISDLADRAVELGMPAVACTDHGNMCAAAEFYQAMRDRGLNPLVGCEFYMAPGDRRDHEPGHPHAAGYHLVLIARDLEGYRNLCRLNSTAWLDGHYYKPRIDKTCLAQWNAGLIGLSACIGGEIPSYLLEDNPAGAKRALGQYLDILGRDNFYIEIQDHAIPDERRVNPQLVELARSNGLPLVATNDVHYLRREHTDAHDVLLCIGTQKNLEDESRLRFVEGQFYFRTGDEMAALFSEVPEALRNTLEVAERCNLALPIGAAAENHYPVYEVPAGFSREGYLRHLCVQGLKQRYGVEANAPEHDDRARLLIERMDYELGVIERTNFVSYFLVVWDFIHYAKENGIPVGPGRGSGAGSIVAYLLRITDIDPIRYGLLFERFLNPDRVSPPDFDIDLCERRRQDVIEYVRGKYGSDSVAQIGTFVKLKPKAVLKDVARVLGRSFDEGNRLTKAVPNDAKKLAKAVEDSPELRQMAETHPWVGEVIQYAKVLEGLSRNTGVHAAGVIIGDQPLADVVPLGRAPGGEVVTQIPAGPCEDMGLLKMDFLGLKTLTIIQDAVDLVRESRGVELDMSELSLDDKKTYELLNRGDTVAVFQLESSGMRDLCRRFGVHRLEDVIALIALYRPGPMQFLDDFISRKHGETPIDYDVPGMKPILEETYGIMLYQEQVMQTVQEVAGFSLGQADLLRRAMGKKKVDVMEEQFDRFIEGCAKNGIDQGLAKGIWEKINKFAGYGFNKSHSAAYAFLSYRTAYLKANYPVEFMAAVMSSAQNKADELAALLNECRNMGIEVRPPAVNASGLRFSVDGDVIVFGLGAIKGVGSAAAEGVIEARREGGPFTDLLDFCERLVGKKVNRRVMESLCRAGAFDCLGHRRSETFAVLDEALSRAQGTAADKAAGQGLLFSIGLEYPELPEWPSQELLAYEKELLGFYVSGHPLAEYADEVRVFSTHGIADIAELAHEAPVRLAGVFSSVTLKRTKKDQREMAITLLEGLDGDAECLFFADAYDKVRDQVVPDRPVFIEGRVDAREDGKRLSGEKVIPMDQAGELLTRAVHVRLREGEVDERRLDELARLCEANPGSAELVLCAMCESGECVFIHSDGHGVANSKAFREGVEDLCGQGALRQKTVPVSVKPRRRPQNGQWRNSNGSNGDG